MVVKVGKSLRILRRAAVLLSILITSCSLIDSDYDVVIIGGGASGVSAGLQSSRMGAKTLIVEESLWLGGMLTSAGVSAIDGNYKLPSGFWGEFKSALVGYYGGVDSLKTGWVSSVLFEPSVGNEILQDLVRKEDKLTLWTETLLLDIKKHGDLWSVMTVNTVTNKTTTVYTSVLIDATELGDVAKICGVKYDIGMESRADTNEDIAPIHKNNIIQDLTYVAILKDYGRDVTIERPEGYIANEFACNCINEKCITPKEPNRMWSKEMMITYGKLPNNKYMINWPIEGNDFYLNLIEKDKEQRESSIASAKHYTLCFLYFIQHELGYNTLGLADDEFPTEDLLPMIPYHRESRRIHGEVRFTLNHVTKLFEQEEPLYRTSIAVGDYPVDHHHARYLGPEQLPDLHFHPIPSYGLPMGALIPKSVDGLIVAEKSISVSNIMNGTTRLQPVVLQIGQAAGTIAALSALNGVAIRDVAVRDVQNVLLEWNGYLMPYLDVPLEDVVFKPLQRIGATGILRGVGKNVGWSNETWFRSNDFLLPNELDGAKEIYTDVNMSKINSSKIVTIKLALDWIAQIVSVEEIGLDGEIEDVAQKIWADFKFGEFDLNKQIKRAEMAVLIDCILDPFNSIGIEINGLIKK